MLALEVLVRAAAGDGASVRSVAEEVNQVGWRDWAREAMRSRLDPLLVVAVLPEPVRVEVARALVVFYGNWGGCFPREYRRVRREWRVLRDRWQGGGRARAYGELLAAVGAPPPALAGASADACARAGSSFVAVAAREDGEAGRRPSAARVEEPSPPPRDGTGGAATKASGMAGGLMLDEPLTREDAAGDAAVERGGNAGAGVAPVREETGEEGLGDVIAGAADSVLPDGSRVVPGIAPEAAGDAPWTERLREAAGREPSVAARMRESWLDADRDGWFGEWLEPAVSRSRERAGR